MVYICLLRGINVGGNNKVSMAKLTQVFNILGFRNIKTYINTGNIIFSSPQKNNLELVKLIEKSIEAEFRFYIKALVKSQKEIEQIVESIPSYFLNNTEMKTDVMFLWEEFDNKKVLKELVIKDNIDNVSYIKGAIIWNNDRKNITKTGMQKLIGTPLYKHMTIRNVNTLRKIYLLMKAVKEN